MEKQAKFITLAELSKADPAKECIVIPEFISENICDAVLRELRAFKESRSANEGRGEDWWYDISKEKTTFVSMNFFRLKNLPALKSVYEAIFRLYKSFGTLEEFDTLDQALQVTDPAVRTVNPLAFWYPPGVGRFEWHQHETTYQQFQLLVNITEPGIDYSGGHTHVRLDGENTVVFDATFRKGCVFSFPYWAFHKVDSIEPPPHPAQTPPIGRISVLMPLHPKKGVGIKYDD